MTNDRRPSPAMRLYDALLATREYVRPMGLDKNEAADDSALTSVVVDGIFDLHELAAALAATSTDVGGPADTDVMNPTPICPIHGIPDCSPLLNACAVLTSRGA